VSYSGKPLIVSNNALEYLTFKQDDKGITFKVKAIKSTQIRLYPALSSVVSRLKMDGQSYKFESTSDGGLLIDISAGEHTFEI
jgi:hypothetical protein